MPYYVYILASNNNNVIYVGVTNNIVRRMYEHKNDVNDGFAKRYHVHKLVYLEETNEIYSALEREKQIKSWSRKRKNALIESLNPSWEEIYCSK